MLVPRFRWIAASLLATTALHAGPGAGTATSSSPYDVEFSADEVTVDGKLLELELEGNVVIVVDRYRLMAEELRLRRGERGVIVTGDGRLAFCRCEDPPVTLGFSEATVAPPSDLLVEDLTLRIGPVPVGWLPYLWLRAPDRSGLLPPRLAWRGRAGPFLGTGLHLPATRATTLDVLLGGYFLGGMEAGLRLASSEARIDALYDHVSDGRLEINARGSHGVRSPEHSEARLSYDADVLAGPYAQRGTPDLAQIAAAYNRAQLALTHSEPSMLFGAALRGSGARAHRDGSGAAYGPNARWWWGHGSRYVRGSTELFAGAVSARSTGPISSIGGEGRVELSAPAGPLLFEAVAHQRAGVSATTVDTLTFSDVGVQAGMGIPLSHPGTSSVPRHVLQPQLEIAGYKVIQSDTLVVSGLRERRQLGRATLGVDTDWGGSGLGRAMSVSARAGWLFDADLPEFVTGSRAVADGSLGQLAVEAASGDRSWALASRARVGQGAGPHVAAFVEGSGGDTRAARWLFGQTVDRFSQNWYSRPGVSGGLELGAPFAGRFAAAAGLTYDLSQGTLLGSRAALAYRHPCRCVAATLWATQRLGRSGTDVWVSVDLTP